MPNKAKKTSGKSLKERVAIARQMTAEQKGDSSADKSADKKRSSGARRGKHSVTSTASAKKATAKDESQGQKTQTKTGKHYGSGSAAKSSEKVKRRSARSENFKEPPREKKKRTWNFPTISTPIKVLIAGVLVVVVALVTLYPATQTYYQTMRDEQRAQAILDAVNARNDIVKQQNEELKSDEGIKDVAAREDGYVEEGDSAAVVTNPGDYSEGSQTMPRHVDRSSIHAPQTWYYSILDTLFMYQEKD